MALRVRSENQILPETQNELPGKGAVSRIPTLKRNVLRDIGNSGTTTGPSDGKGKQQAGFKKPLVEKSKNVEKILEIPVETTTSKAFSVQHYIPDVDLDDHTNPQLMSQYVNKVYSFLRELEDQYPIEGGYMTGMKVRPSMRTILVDWLVDVHQRFKLLPETLYLTVAVMDRFLQEDKNVTRAELQLVGLASLFISCKYEEMYMPGVDEFVYMSDNAYSGRELLQMEMRILKALQFSLGRPLPLHFLRRYSKVASVVNEDVDALHHTLAKYLMELTLTEYNFAHHKPSELAAAALCLSLRVLDEKGASVQSLWNETMVHYSGYKAEDLEPVMRKLAALVENSATSKYQAIRNKYCSSKNYNIATLYKLGGEVVKSLAAKNNAS